MAVPGAAAPVGLDGNGLNGPGNIFRDAAQQKHHIESAFLGANIVMIAILHEKTPHGKRPLVLVHLFLRIIWRKQGHGR